MRSIIKSLLLVTLLIISTNCQADTSAIDITTEHDIKQTVGSTFTVLIKGNRSTGYQWIVDSELNDGIRLLNENGDAKYVSDPNPSGLGGVGGYFTFDFEAVKAGTYDVNFKYVRPWDATNVGDQFTSLFTIEDIVVEEATEVDVVPDINNDEEGVIIDSDKDNDVAPVIIIPVEEVIIGSEEENKDNDEIDNDSTSDNLSEDVETFDVLDKQDIEIEAGKPFAIQIKGNKSTGYNWEINSDLEQLAEEGLTVISNNGLPLYIDDSSEALLGVGGYFKWNLIASKVGNYTISFVYKIPAGLVAGGDDLVVNINVIEAETIEEEPTEEEPVVEEPTEEEPVVEEPIEEEPTEEEPIEEEPIEEEPIEEEPTEEEPVVEEPTEEEPVEEEPTEEEPIEEEPTEEEPIEEEPTEEEPIEEEPVEEEPIEEEPIEEEPVVEEPIEEEPIEEEPIEEEPIEEEPIEEEPTEEEPVVEEPIEEEPVEEEPTEEEVDEEEPVVEEPVEEEPTEEEVDEEDTQELQTDFNLANSTDITASINYQLNLIVYGNESAGYKWQLASDAEQLKEQGFEIAAEGKYYENITEEVLLGAGGYYVFPFTATKVGVYEVEFKQVFSNEEANEGDTIKATITAIDSGYVKPADEVIEEDINEKNLDEALNKIREYIKENSKKSNLRSRFTKVTEFKFTFEEEEYPLEI